MVIYSNIQYNIVIYRYIIDMSGIETDSDTRREEKGMVRWSDLWGSGSRDRV